MHSFEVHSNESACRKSGRLGMEQVTCIQDHLSFFLWFLGLFLIWYINIITNRYLEPSYLLFFIQDLCGHYFIFNDTLPKPQNL